MKLFRPKIRVPELYMLHAILDLHAWQNLKHDGIAYHVCKCGRVEMFHETDGRWSVSQHDMNELNVNIMKSDNPMQVFKISKEFMQRCKQKGVSYEI